MTLQMRDCHQQREQDGRVHGVFGREHVRQCVRSGVESHGKDRKKVIRRKVIAIFREV